MKVFFHINECKISHFESKVNDCIIKRLHQQYEIIFEDGSGKMSVSRCKVYEYLRMTLDYTVCGQVRIMMLSYAQDILTDFDKAYLKERGTKSSAATNNIFVVKKDCKKLDQENFMDCHNLVSKILYATKRARPDTCTAIAFLKTRVRAPNKDNWDKFVHLMRYIRGKHKL